MAATDSIAIPPRVKDLTGKPFGRLTVLFYVGGKPTRWLCRCKCGSETVAKADRLMGGQESCGCVKREKLIARNTTHGKSSTTEYLVWQGILDRCYNPNSLAHDRYGGRGITVCKRWRNSFWAFLEDMGPRPSSGHSIERVDNDGHYEPGNCVWATKKEQARNRRSSRYLTFNGQTKLLADWAVEIGVPYFTLYSRVMIYGWSVERAMATSPE